MPPNRKSEFANLGDFLKFQIDWSIQGRGDCDTVCEEEGCLFGVRPWAAIPRGGARRQPALAELWRPQLAQWRTSPLSAAGRPVLSCPWWGCGAICPGCGGGVLLLGRWGRAPFVFVAVDGHKGCGRGHRRIVCGFQRRGGFVCGHGWVWVLRVALRGPAPLRAPVGPVPPEAAPV